MDHTQEIILLNATPYSMTDEETGELNEGISLRYVTGGNLDPVVDEGSIGVMPAKASVPLALQDKLLVAPGLYKASFSIKVNARGQSVLKLVDLECKGAVAVALCGSPGEEPSGAKK